MALHKSDPLSLTFAALADPTRRAILERLTRGEADVTELTKPFRLSQPAISKHLHVLEVAGLVVRAQDAQRRPRKLEAAPLADAAQWLEMYREFWKTSFARLDGLLGELKAADKQRRRTAARKPRRSRPAVSRQL